MDYNFIGIDLGSKTSIVSHLKGQVNNVVLNEIGGRETPVCISYSDQQRLFGEQAVVTTRSRPLATILTPQRFLTSDPKQIQIESPFTQAKFEKDHFHVEGPNLNLDLSPQEVITGYLNYLQALTKDIPQTSPFFYTLSAPNHLGYKAKKQLSKCIASVVPTPPSLVSQKMAVGLDYLINTSKDKQTVLFVDFGHCKISAYALKFTNQSIVELMEGSYSNLGVRCLDVQLIKHFESLIKFKLNDKNRLKLKDIAAKTRTILSANSQHTIHQDFGEHDFECKVSRQQFQKICQTPFSYIQNFLELTKKNLLQRGIKVDKMQVFGGGSRIPYFQQILASVFKLPAKKAINNQAISRGCALYAHHKEKISKLGKIELKEILKCRIKLFINHYQKQAAGYHLDPRRAQNLQNHILYEPGTFNDDKKLTIQPRKDTSIQIWFITDEAEPMTEYYNISHDQIDKQIVMLNIDISMVDGYPKIRSIVGQMKNPGLTKNVPVFYDCKQEVDSLRVRQLQFRAVDLKVIAVQQKRNKIQSEVNRVKDRFPQAENYLQVMMNMNVHELDQVLRQLSAMQ